MARKSNPSLQTPIDIRAWKYIKSINSVSEESLSKIAIEDGCKKYTYSDMFEYWDKYAAVFSALGMTGSKNARVGIAGSIAVETTFAIYGLNMVGAEVSVVAPFFVLNFNKLVQTIKNEKITDLILSDDFAQGELLVSLFTMKESLGLNNIIYLHIPVGGSCIDPNFSYTQEYKYRYMKYYFNAICMDTLIAQYEKAEIEYADDISNDTSFILHTSGTSTGTGKPIPLSDKSMNFFGNCYCRIPGVEGLREGAVCGVTIDLSNAYGLINQVHGALAVNGTVVMLSGGAINPWYFNAIPAHKISVLFTIPALFEMWMKMPPITRFDFSSLKGIIIGGSAASASDKKRYLNFLKKHGAKDVMFINGYGLSELGGACILSTPDIEDESIGYPLPGVDILLFDEDSGKYLIAKDAPCEGILYLHSDAMTCGRLDGEEIIKQDVIYGKPYICSNDLVRMIEDGKIEYLGRANRFFINNSGIKYETGKVETAFSGQEGIESCGIVAVYEKTSHDNIPMLCVKPLVNDGSANEVIIAAMKNIFVEKKTLSTDNIPCRVLIADELPRNTNGKIDVAKISKGEVTGKRYSVKQIKRGKCVTDFRLIPLKDDEDNMIQQVISGLAKEFIPGGAKSDMNNNANNANQNEARINQFALMMMNYANWLYMVNWQMAEVVFKLFKI